MRTSGYFNVRTGGDFAKRMDGYLYANTHANTLLLSNAAVWNFHANTY